MSQKLLSITVKGSHKTWSFNFYANPKYIEEWRNDGLEIDIIHNTVPMCIADAGLVSQWCWLQDLFNFKFMDWFRK
jgi:hypothetical protein